MAKIIVIGCGMVGKTIATDLSKRHKVTAADISQVSLNVLSNKIKTILLDGEKGSIQKAVKGFDLAICAVPGFIGFETLKSIIEAKVNVVDISFFPENALELDELAKKNGVIAAVDMGVAPGLSNLILGHHDASLGINAFECLVGGLPAEHSTYKAPFSPIDVIQEYLRPVRMRENGKDVIKEALSEPELVKLPGVGTLEAFNTDGLRSLLHTMPHIPNMREKTLRYPGYRDQILFMIEHGFFSDKNINFTSKILFDKWKLTPEDDEFTVMRVKITVDIHEQYQHIWRLYDETDNTTRTSSMSRTTGYTCCAVAEAILAEMWTTTGIIPGELLGADKSVFNCVLSFLKCKGVKIDYIFTGKNVWT